MSLTNGNIILEKHHMPQGSKRREVSIIIVIDICPLRLRIVKTNLIKILTLNKKVKIVKEIILMILVSGNESKSEEAIIVKDLLSFLNKYNNVRFKILTCNKKYTLGLCRNIGSKFAESDYIVFLDDDVVVSSSWIEGLALLINSDCDIATGPIIPPITIKRIINNHRLLKRDIVLGILTLYNYKFIIKCRYFCKITRYLYVLMPSKSLNYIDLRRCTVGFWGANLLVKREIFHLLGGMSSLLGYRSGKVLGGEETRLVMKACKRGLKVMFCTKAMVYHFINPKKLSVTYILQKILYVILGTLLVLIEVYIKG